MAVKPITCTSISGVPNSTFNLTVNLLDASDVPITNNPNIIQGQQFTRPDTSVPFTLPYQLGNADINIPNVKYSVKYGSRIIWTSPLFNLVANCAAVTETPVTPNWINKLGFKYNATNHQFELNTNGDLSLQLKLEAITFPQPSGVSQDSIPWDNNVWLSGSTTGAATSLGYNKLFVFNPVVSGSGGIIINKEYRIKARRSSNPSEVYYINFTSPPTTVSTVTAIPLPSALPTCTVPPTITELVSTTSLQIVFRYNAEGVYKQLLEIINEAGNIVKSTVMDMVVGGVSGGAPIFNPSYQPIWNYDTPLAPGIYRLRVKGSSCYSDYSTSQPFTIAIPVTTTLAPGVTTTVDPGLTTTLPPANTYTPIRMFSTPTDIIDIRITGYNGGTSKDWVLNDFSTVNLDSDKEWKYNINGFIVRSKTPLTNYRFRGNDTVWIYKEGMLTGLDNGDYRWCDPGTTQFIPGYSVPNAGQTYTRNVSGGYQCFGFKKN